MVWSKMPSDNLLMRSHHSMYIHSSIVYVIGGYSWSENKAKKLFPVTEVTRFIFTDDFQVQHVDVIKLTMDLEPEFPHFITGFASAGLGPTIFLFGGIPYPDYDSEKENLHSLLPPETPRNKVPDPIPQLLKIKLNEQSVSVISGPGDAVGHNGSLQILNLIEPLLIMTCDPHLYIYRPR